jgi:hypothetical protein
LPKYTPSISALKNTLLTAYDGLNPLSVEDSKVNAALVSHVESWLTSPNREISESAIGAVNRFVAAELDFVTLGNRGLGRLNEEWPRFGGQYRIVLRELPSEQIERLRQAFGDEICSGYLFCEYLVECFTGHVVPRVDYSDAIEELIESWVPTIYSQFGPREFDAKMAADNLKGYYDVKGLWGHATGDAVHNAFLSMGIPIDDFAQLLIRQYFDAGMMLRMAETERSNNRITETSVQNRAGDSTIPKKSGCTAAIFAFFALATVLSVICQVFAQRCIAQ